MGKQFWQYWVRMQTEWNTQSYVDQQRDLPLKRSATNTAGQTPLKKKKKSTFLNQQEALTKAYCNVALFRKVPITQLYVLVVPLKSLPVTVFQVYLGICNALYLYPGNTVGVTVKSIWFLGRKSSYHNSVITIWIMPTRCNTLCEVFCFIA